MTKKRTITAATGVIAAALLFFAAGIEVPVLDSRTDAYFRDAITKAGLAYATCRLINASVSIIKESELQLEPAGVGVSLAIGQALDPIDDLTERLSGVLVTAITALGVQKLVYEISQSLAPPVFAFFLFIFALLHVVRPGHRTAVLQQVLLGILVFIAIARFCLPLSSLANDFIHSQFFDDQISEANNELSIGTAELEKLMDFSLPEIDGLLGTIENSASFIKRKTVEFKDALGSTLDNMGGMIENLLNLTFLYVGIFLVQVIFLPLLSIWLLMKIAQMLFNPQREGLSGQAPAAESGIARARPAPRWRIW